MTERLGLVGNTFNCSAEFHGVLLQIGHKGQEPKCDEPAFRLLRFTSDRRDMAASMNKLHEKLPGSGNILYHLRESATLICQSLDRQVDASYVVPKTNALKQAYLDFVAFKDTDYALSHQERREGNQDGARERQAQFINAFNAKGWVKYMRNKLKIDDSIQIIPGMHGEAEVQSKMLRSTKAASSDFSSPVNNEVNNDVTDDDASNVDRDDDDTADEEGANAFPPAARKKGQAYAAVSMIMDDSDDMEMLLYVHAVYPNMKAAKDHVKGELGEILHPLPVDVVDMYEWIYPVRMQWNNSHLSSRVTGLEETWANDELKETQEDRSSAVMRNRDLKQAVAKKKEMKESVQKEICERLWLTPEQLLAIVDDKRLGAQPVMDLCKIDDTDERRVGVDKILALIPNP